MMRLYPTDPETPFVEAALLWGVFVEDELDSAFSSEANAEAAVMQMETVYPGQVRLRRIHARWTPAEQ